MNKSQVINIIVEVVVTDRFHCIEKECNAKKKWLFPYTNLKWKKNRYFLERAYQQIRTTFGIEIAKDIFLHASFLFSWGNYQFTGDPLHSRALAHSRAPLFTQPCPHCSHSRAPGEQWARLCVFTLQGCVQTARLCRGSPVQFNELR